MTAIRFDASLFLAAYACVSTEQTRYYLQGVYVCPAPDPANAGAGVLMVATDGHRMALVHDANGRIDRGRILRLDPKSKALKPARGETGRILHIDAIERGRDAVARVLLGHESDCSQVDVLSVHEIDGAFPDWTRVLPEDPVEGIAVHSGNSFNPDYLAGFGKAFKALCGSSAFAIAQPAKGSPAWVWSNNAPQVRFVCMPMRCESDPGRPAWLTQAEQPS
jgi:hypothetical protein